MQPEKDSRVESNTPATDESLHDSFDSLSRTALRCKAERDALLEAAKDIRLLIESYEALFHRNPIWITITGSNPFRNLKAAIEKAEAPHVS